MTEIEILKQKIKDLEEANEFLREEAVKQSQDLNLLGTQILDFTKNLTEKAKESGENSKIYLEVAEGLTKILLPT